jgi:hypothetical protein
MDMKLNLSPKLQDRLRVFESRVLRRIFGPKMAEVTGKGKIVPVLN